MWIAPFAQFGNFICHPNEIRENSYLKNMAWTWNERLKGVLFYPPGNYHIPIPPWEKEHDLQTCLGIGYLSCREGTTSIKTFANFLLSYLPYHPRHLCQLKTKTHQPQGDVWEVSFKKKNKFTLVDWFVWLIWLCDLVRCKTGMLLSCLHLFLCQKVEAWDFYPRKQVALNFHQLSPQNQPARCPKKSDTFLGFPGRYFFEVWHAVRIFPEKPVASTVKCWSKTFATASLGGWWSYHLSAAVANQKLWYPLPETSTADVSVLVVCYIYKRFYMILPQRFTKQQKSQSKLFSEHFCHWNPVGLCQECRKTILI